MFRIFNQFISFFTYSLKKKHLFIMTPKGKKKTIFFEISNLKILIFLSAFIIVIFLIIPHLAQKSQLKLEIKQTQIIQDSYKQKINKYKKLISKNQSQFEKYSKEVNNILNIFGDLGENKTQTKQKKKYLERFYGEYELAEKFETPKEILDLNQIRFKTIKALKDLKNIDDFIKIRKIVIKHIPTKWPIIENKGYKTSSFGVRNSPFLGKGAFHTGVDIAAKPNTPIVSSADGVIVFAGIKTGYGFTVIIQHKFGYKTLYGHNAKLFVRLNQKVRKGQKIALLGNTGRTTGYHLHFEVRINDVPVDPWPYLTVEI